MKKVLVFIILLLLIPSGFGISEVPLNDVRKPVGAILFIVDGFGSSYYYPEFTPYSLGNEELEKATLPNLTFGARIIDIRTPVPVTGIAHSIIVTGYSKSTEDVVGFPEATIFDITRQHGYINLAVMETGDFYNMREEQDIIMYAKNNSIDEPEFSIEAKNPISDVNELMVEWKTKLPSYLSNKSGAEQYSMYNKWGIDTANAVALQMINKHPGKKFLLTMNVGAVDSGGHNMGDDDYIRIIQALNRDFFTLYRTASENNIAIFFTADHGMSFAVKNARRGGHSGDKYVNRDESLRIPLVIISPNTVSGTISGKYGQEDIAPTILSVLDLPNHLQYNDGVTIPVKNYASVFIKTDSQYSVSLWNGTQKEKEIAGDDLAFTGLPLYSNYTLKAKGSGGDFEEKLFLDSDKQFNFKENKAGIGGMGMMGSRKMIAIFLILLVNIIGLAIIKRMKD
jgi:hypothetical protein